MRIILIAAVAATAALALAGNASAWRSNEFISPSGNIHCELMDYWSGVTCMLANNRRQAVVSRIGRAREVYTWPDPQVSYQYVLRYGGTWTAGRYICRSFSSQMVCSNRWTGHGFAISREFLRTW